MYAPLLDLTTTRLLSSRLLTLFSAILDVVDLAAGSSGAPDPRKYSSTLAALLSLFSGVPFCHSLTTLFSRSRADSNPLRNQRVGSVIRVHRRRSWCSGCEGMLNLTLSSYRILNLC
jgi:hypothetical protein